MKVARTLQDLQDGTKNEFSIVPKVPATGILKIFENSIKFYNPDQPASFCDPPERTENDIKTFSAKSRKRLFDIFNSLNYSKYGTPMFLSLTWHYDDPDNRKSIKTFLRNYLKRLNRFLPPYHYIWKFEYQERGVPHFHIMILPLDKNLKIYSKENELKIKNAWLELKDCKCKHCKKYSAHVVEVKNYKMALSYIAKEIAKVQERYEDHDLGRIWGTSQNLRCDPVDEINITLNRYEAYLNKAIEIIQNKIDNYPDKNSKIYKNYLSSFNYLHGLKYLPYNSQVFIQYSEIRDLIIQDKLVHKINTKPKSFVLKKYRWNDG